MRNGYGSGIRRSAARDLTAPQRSIRINLAGDRDQRRIKMTTMVLVTRLLSRPIVAKSVKDLGKSQVIAPPHTRMRKTNPEVRQFG